MDKDTFNRYSGINDEPVAHLEGAHYLNDQLGLQVM